MPGLSTRLIHAMDRAGDNWGAMKAYASAGMGFLLRAQHDRALAETRERLWARLGSRPACGVMTVEVGSQRDGLGRVRIKAREAEAVIRFARVEIVTPVNDPRCAGDGPREVWAVHAREDHPPEGEGIEPLEWMLLTSEAVEDEASARRVIGWYQRRWVVEEFHRVLKEGCALERSQLDSAEKLHRLASLKSVVAVRMLQVRDLAEAADPPGGSPSPGDRPEALRGAAPWEWIVVVSHLAGIADPLRLTPRLEIPVAGLARGHDLRRSRTNPPRLHAEKKMCVRVRASRPRLAVAQTTTRRGWYGRG